MLDYKDIMPEVVQVIPDDSFGIFAYFNDGSVRYKNLREYIDQGGVFAQLADINIFKNTITVMNGTVSWDVEGKWDEKAVLDIDPVELYETSAVVRCPMEK